jgi:hypothetical protein
MTLQAGESFERTGVARLSVKSASLLTGLIAAVGLFYLSMRGGGYELTARAEIGLVVWWLIAVLGALGVIPAGRPGRSALVMLGAMAALAAWTAIAIIWSPSAERGMVEVERVLTLGGILTLAMLSSPARYAKALLWGVAAAIVAVAAIGILSQLRKGWFPDYGTAEDLGGQVLVRLSYPLRNWNGLAEMFAMGGALLVGLGAVARRPRWAALACAAVPLLVVASYLTLSRTGIGCALLALLMVLVLHPLRRQVAVIAFVGLVTGTLAVGVTAAVPGASEGGANGGEAAAIIVVTLLCCALAAALLTGLGRYGALAWLQGLGRDLDQKTSRIFKAAGAVAIAAVVLFSIPSLLNGWSEFKKPETPGASAERYTSATGSGRYQWWSAAVDAGVEEPLTGAGPGTFEFVWSENGTIPGFVRDAHSLYLETFGELGVIGLLLLLALIFTPLARSVRGAVGDGGRIERGAFAAAAGGITAFALAAAFDWAWETTALSAAFMLVAAGALRLGGAEEPKGAKKSRPNIPLRIGLAVCGLVAVVVISIPLTMQKALDRSAADLKAGDLQGALDQAAEAGQIEPYAASPLIAQTIVYESAGDYRSALETAREATRRDSTNWQTWYLLARIQRWLGNEEAAIVAYERAVELNPRSEELSKPYEEATLR